MAINFPDSPSLNDEYTAGGRTWVWNGSSWDSLPTSAPGEVLSSFLLMGA